MAAVLVRRLWKVAAVVVLVAAVVMLAVIGHHAVSHLLHLRYFQITGLVVEGNLRVPTATIIQTLGLSAHASILEVDMRGLAGRIMLNPWIKTASVSRRLPSGLLIRVSERLPRAIVLADRAYLVSDDGLILQEATPLEVLDLPILRVKGDHTLRVGERMDVVLLEQGTRLWRQFHQEALGPGIKAREISLEADGSCTVLLARGMPYLRFRGDASPWQLDRLPRVLQLRGIGLHELEYADLRFADKVIVKPLPKGGGV